MPSAAFRPEKSPPGAHGGVGTIVLTLWDTPERRISFVASYFDASSRLRVQLTLSSRT
jgi:hypothetical protein